jgi:hypothetical protein
MNHDADTIAVSSDGSRFISLWDKYLALWDLENYKCLARTEYTSSYLSYNPSSLRVAFTLDGNGVFTDDGVNTHRWCISPASPGHNQSALLPMTFTPMPQELSHQEWSPQNPSYRYEWNDEWMMDHDGRHILWVPPDKRGVDSVVVRGKKTAVGIGNENVYTFYFSSNVSLT